MVQASPEYLRFEGTVRSDYDIQALVPWGGTLDSRVDFQPGQFVWFDFVVDTAVQPAGLQDDTYIDFFVSTYLQGSLLPSASIGKTPWFPEGKITWLELAGGQLLVGMTWNRLPDDGVPPDLGISTWQVGQAIDLMAFSYFDDNRIGQLTLTYRASEAPPAMVPLPAGLPLLGTAMALVAAARLRRHSPAG